MSDEWYSEPIVGIVHDVETSMDKVVRDLWVAALLSGRYPQGYDRLRSADGTYTALGVLVDVATKVHVCTWESVDGEFFVAGDNPPSTGSHLPSVVRDWAKITGTHPSQELPLMYEGHRHPIWRLSDIKKLPFEDLANLILTQY